MTQNNLNQILSKKKVRITPIRLAVLDYLVTQNKAVSAHDIEQSFDQDIDRITLYRTLKKFSEHGIIHRIEANQQTYYALCSDCSKHNHHDNHVHFKCVRCDTIECIHENGSIDFSVPKEYHVERMSILLEGTCKSCI